MSIPDDLLWQAWMLATLDARRPKQVNLRRAISTAYYALFHLLTIDAARLFVKDDLEMASRVARSFNHANLRDVSNEFKNNQLPKSIRPPDVSVVILPGLKSVASSFSKLQQARHMADYNLSQTIRRRVALSFVGEAQSAFANWLIVKGSDQARLYLACFSMWDSWNKPPR